jgi:hypothetical protein
MPFDLDRKAIEGVFLGTWIALGIGGWIFMRRASPALKQKIWPISTIVVGLLFLFFVYLLDGIKSVTFAAIPIALITFLNLKTVKFCSNCGALNRSHTIFPIPKYCQKCGVTLDTPVVSGG